MEEVRHSRFKGAEWYSEDLSTYRTLVGGAGGIGSWLTYFLYKIGLHITIVDSDRVEEHNLGGQLLSGFDLGKYKTEAVANMLRLTEGKPYLNNLYERKEWITEETSLRYMYMFSAFDNMTARKILFEKWVDHNFVCSEEDVYTPISTLNAPIFIDGRLEMEQIQIFAITTSEQIHKYRDEHLFDEADVEEAACTMKQTSHTAAMIGAKMASIFTNHLSNINSGSKNRIVPFYYEEFTPLLLNTVEI